MPKVAFDQLNYTELTPTPMQLQLADSSVCHPERTAEDVPVRVRDCFVPVDFVVLDMDNQKETTLILGWPFLNTADAHCNTRFIKGHKPSNHIRARIKSHVYTTE